VKERDLVREYTNDNLVKLKEQHVAQMNRFSDDARIMMETLTTEIVDPLPDKVDTLQFFQSFEKLPKEYLSFQKQLKSTVQQLHAVESEFQKKFPSESYFEFLSDLTVTPNYFSSYSKRLLNEYVGKPLKNAVFSVFSRIPFWFFLLCLFFLIVVCSVYFTDAFSGALTSTSPETTAVVIKHTDEIIFPDKGYHPYFTFLSSQWLLFLQFCSQRSIFPVTFPCSSFIVFHLFIFSRFHCSF
jgi:uncharacterized membrane protein (GlpM family)